MMNLFDMLAQGESGNALDALARQFNLSQKQTREAVEALMPAFSQGLKRNTADPTGMGNFMSAMASGQHAKYFEDMQSAFAPQGVAEGNGILGHLFGSKDLSRAVAGQAAQATGIGQSILQQMLPVIASMIMGGLFKQSTGQMQAGAGAGSNPLTEIMEQMMRQGGGIFGGGAAAHPRSGQSEPSVSPFDNPFGKVLQDMFGGQSAGAQPQAGSPAGDNPFGKMFEDMMGRTGTTRDRPRPDEPAETPSGRARTPYDDVFGKMFETGAKQRDDYQKGVESIFDQFTKGMDRPK